MGLASLHTCVLAGKHLGHIVERLEFEGISARVEKEHGCLLPDLTFEANMWLDHELDFGCLQALGECFPLLHGKDGPEMTDRDVMSIDGTRRFVSYLIGSKVSDDLVTIKIEVDPVIGTAPLPTSQQISVEATCAGQIVNGKCEME